MSGEEIKILINKFFDGELEKSNEPELFNILSKDVKAREYFKELNFIKETLQQTKEDFPEELDERILFSIGDISGNSISSFFLGKRLSAVIAYSFAVILMIFSIFFFAQSNSYQKQLDLSLKEIDQKDQMINLLYNSMPSAEVVSNESNQVVITAEM